MVKLLDCTLRDGGYYTNWNYSGRTIREYFKHLSKLPVDYAEIGYRSLRSDEYLGELFYTPLYVLQTAHELMPHIRKAIMLDEKDTAPRDLDVLLDPIRDWVQLIRIAVSPERLTQGMLLARMARDKGFEVAVNLMHASHWRNDAGLPDRIKREAEGIDYLYIVDSYGALHPSDVQYLVQALKPELAVPLGFHGHNNLELALSNSLMAIECGCDIIDTTVTGMGRGAGNLKTELALIVLKEKYKFNLDFDSLSSLTGLFEPLQKKYAWGTNIAYMLSGAYSIPQKEVMAQMNKHRHFIGNIIGEWKSYVSNGAAQAAAVYPCLRQQPGADMVIVTGGGASTEEQAGALHRFAAIETAKGRRVSLVHSSTRFAGLFNGLQGAGQYYCLVGKEGKRLESFAGSRDIIRNNRFIVPSQNRVKGIYLPNTGEAEVLQCAELQFAPGFDDSPLALGIQAALDLRAATIYLFGFDGYLVQQDSSQLDLFNENQQIINKAAAAGIGLVSLTPTRYQGLRQVSIFHLITKHSA
jgi:4-hydroxy 2-oxovalerate aldolase